jgi:tetratricopeptide (TPR) repeat protein
MMFTINRSSDTSQTKTGKARSNRAVIALAGIAFSIITSQTFAQSVSVIGNSGYAQLCFEAASMAARVQSASNSDLKACTNAIDYELLNKSDLVATYVNRGVIYVTLERHNLAIRDYQKAMAMDDSLPAIYLNRGNLWFMSQRFDKAIDDYSTSLQMDIFQRHVALLNRGLAYEYQGDFDKAEEDYQASLALKPEWHIPQDKLIRLKEKRSAKSAL